MQGDFVTWDDDRNFLDNPRYRGLGPAQLQWMWTTFHMGHYVPLSWMSLGFDYVVWGMNPTGYHLTNVLLHAANAVVVYFIAKRLLPLTGPSAANADARTLSFAAACVSLLFAVHPLRVESVAWITERRDVLSGLFFFSCVLCYLRSLATSEVHPRRWYWITVALFPLALLSKATAMTLPAVLLLLNIYPLRRLGSDAGWTGTRARSVYLELVPFALFAGAAALLSIIALHPPDQLTLGAKIAVSAYSLAFYLWKTVLPAGLAPLYPMPQHVNPWSAIYVASYVVFLAVLLLAFGARRRWPGLTTAWIAFLLVMLPMLGVVQNGPQIAADRYTYQAAPILALLGGAAVLASGAALLNAARVAACTVLFALAALTWRQSNVWRDSEHLWTQVLDVSPESSIGQVALGSLLVKQGRLPEGVAHYERGLALDSLYAEGYNNLGVALAQLGRPREAVERYRRALHLKPAYPEAHENWGAAIAQEGQFEEAIAHYRQALDIDSTRATAHVNWGNALVRIQRIDEALPHYREAVRLRPDLADAQLNWGVALAQSGQLAEAIEHFQRAHDLDPQRVDAAEYLARASTLLQQRQGNGRAP